MVISSFGVAATLIFSSANIGGDVVCGQTIKARTVELVCEGGRMTDLSAVARFRGLESLELRSVELGTLAGIEKAPHLKELVLEDVSVRNILPVAGLQKLERLRLANTKVEDLAPVAELTSLTRLEVRHSPVTDISALRNLRGLKLVDLTGTEVESVDALKNLHRLVTLGLRGTDVISLTPLKKLARLEVIDIIDTDIASISALTEFEKLTVLLFEPSTFRTLRPLKRLPHLLAIGIPAERPLTNPKRFMSVYSGAGFNGTMGPGSVSSSDVDGQIRRIRRAVKPHVKLYRLKDNDYQIDVVAKQL